jgi:hypothetical protein
VPDDKLSEVFADSRGKAGRQPCPKDSASLHHWVKDGNYVDLFTKAPRSRYHCANCRATVSVPEDQKPSPCAMMPWLIPNGQRSSSCTS